MVAKHDRGELSVDEIRTLDLAVDKYMKDRNLFLAPTVPGAFTAISKFGRSDDHLDRLIRYQCERGERRGETIEELIEKIKICLGSDESDVPVIDTDDEEVEGDNVRNNEEGRMVEDNDRSMRMNRDDGMSGDFRRSILSLEAVTRENLARINEEQRMIATGRVVESIDLTQDSDDEEVEGVFVYSDVRTSRHVVTNNEDIFDMMRMNGDDGVRRERRTLYLDQLARSNEDQRITEVIDLTGESDGEGEGNFILFLKIIFDIT